jgi:two-component system phosphate regulon sensor histidine kinase PhoR
MIHDMKNPIASIVSGISSLKSGKLDDKPEAKEHHYKIITQNGERMLRLVNKVLEVANLEDRSAVVTKTSVNLPDLLNDLIDKYQTNAAKSVFFHINLNGVETVYADRHYIYEAFDNLIENAIKYSKENEDADLTITSIQKRNETQLSFKDLGIGIAEKDQKKIFQKFERSMAVISAKNKISGFGLGLNFVYQVIKAHGGTIKVNSRLGSYSELIINIPYKDGNDKTVTD